MPNYYLEFDEDSDKLKHFNTLVDIKRKIG